MTESHYKFAFGLILRRRRSVAGMVLRDSSFFFPCPIGRIELFYRFRRWKLKNGQQPRHRQFKTSFSQNQLYWNMETQAVQSSTKRKNIYRVIKFICVINIKETEEVYWETLFRFNQIKRR